VEHQLCRIEGATLVPLGSLAAGLQTLPDVDEVICYCHHGMRSLDAAAWLRFQGSKKRNLWLAGLNGGRLKSIRKFRDTERSVSENKALPKRKLNFCRSRLERRVASKSLLLEMGAELESRDLDKERLTEAELDELIGSRDYKEFLNTRNELYRMRKMKEHPPTRAEAIKLMAKEPNLIRRPIVLQGSQMILGFDEDAYKKLLK